MKLKNIIKFPILASVAMFTLGSVQGAVTAGNLILFFQKTGDTDTVYVNLGSAATLYRGTASGPTADRQALGIIDISSTLATAFGAAWATDPDIYAGLSGVYTNITTDTVLDGDQYRTHYVSRARTSVGTVGASGSVAYDLISAGNLTGGATAMNGMTTNFTAQLGSADQGIVTTSLSVIDDWNPTSPLGVQSTAFNQYTTGVQQRGDSLAFGVFGAAGQVEFALDLQRLVPNAAVSAGEVAGDPLGRIGTYEGTVTIGTDGMVSFITIPEPSSVTLAGLAGLALAFRRRRNA